MDIIKPTNGRVVGRVTLADEEDTRHDIAEARIASATFGQSTKEERPKILRRLHEAASPRLDDLTAAMNGWRRDVDEERQIVDVALEAGKRYCDAHVGGITAAAANRSSGSVADARSHLRWCARLSTEKMQH
jgi:acyl-CoA reductase-like NAD-dependent aldehyde dehydrogenase